MLVVSIWFHIGLSVLSVVVGMAGAAAWALIGGVGVLSALTKRLEATESGMEHLDRRLTTEIKTRASVKGVEARQEAKSVQDEARVRLAGEPAPAKQQRPSVITMMRR